MKCSKCKQDKQETQFYKNKSRFNGLDFYCKECRKKATYNAIKQKVLKDLISAGG